MGHPLPGRSVGHELGRGGVGRGKGARRLEPHRHLFGIGLAAERLSEHRRHPLGRLAAAVGKEPAGPMVGHGEDEWVVHEDQRLRWHARDVALSGGDLRCREIEADEEWRRRHDRHLEVDRAPPFPVEWAGEEPLGGILEKAVRSDRTPSEPGIEPARDGEEAVADPLGVEPAGGMVVEETVVGIGDERCCGSARALAEGLREDEPADEPFCRPAIAHEFDRQKIEELRMGGAVAEPAEIARRGNQAGAEHPLPDPIDVDARCLRIAFTGKRQGQLEPATPGGWSDAMAR